METTQCQRCFHYGACKAIDLSGTVGNPEYENQPCEHYIDSELIEIREKTKWIRNIKRYSDGDVYVDYKCAHCGNMRRVRSFKNKEWDDYYHEHHRDNEDAELPKYCEVCGSALNGVMCTTYAEMGRK